MQKNALFCNENQFVLLIASDLPIFTPRSD
jgi:hypothetical protein